MKKQKQVMTTDEMQEEIQRLQTTVYVQTRLLSEHNHNNKVIKKLPRIVKKMCGIR